MAFNFNAAINQVLKCKAVVKIPRLCDHEIQAYLPNDCGRRRRNAKRKHDKLNFDRVDDDLYFSMICEQSSIPEPTRKRRSRKKPIKEPPLTPKNEAESVSTDRECPNSLSGVATSTEESSNQVPVIVKAPVIEPPPPTVPLPSLQSSPMRASPILSSSTPPPPSIPQKPLVDQKSLVLEEKKLLPVKPSFARLRVKTAKELGTYLAFVDESSSQTVQPEGQNFLENAFSSSACTSSLPPPAHTTISKKLDMPTIGKLYKKYLTPESQEKISCVARTLRDIEKHNDEANKILDKVQKSKSSEAEKLMLRHQTYGEMKRKRVSCATTIKEQLSFLNSVKDEELELLLQFLFLSILKISHTPNSASYKKGTLFKTISKELCSCFETVEGTNDRLSSVIKKPTFRTDVQELYKFLEKNKQHKFFEFPSSEEVSERKKKKHSQTALNSSHIIHINEVDAMKCLPCGSHLLATKVNGKTFIPPSLANTRPNIGMRALPVMTNKDQEVLKYTLKLDGPTVTLHPEGTTAPLPLQNSAERTLPNGQRGTPLSYHQTTMPTTTIAPTIQSPFGSTINMTASHTPFNSVPTNVTKTSVPGPHYQDARHAPVMNLNGTLTHDPFANQSIHPIHSAKNAIMTGRAKNNENQIPFQTTSNNRPPVLKSLSTNIMVPSVNPDYGAELNRFITVQSNGVLQQQQLNPKHKCLSSYCRNDATVICGGCSQAFYCSNHCQASDWANGHSRICKPMNPENVLR